MARFLKDRSNKHGLAPGSLVFIGKQNLEKPILRVMNYNSDSLEEKEIDSVYDIQEDLKQAGVTWLNIYGVHNVKLIAELGNAFSLPPLLLEDILNTDSRPKYEDQEHFDAFILKMLRYDHAFGKIVAERSRSAFSSVKTM